MAPNTDMVEVVAPQPDSQAALATRALQLDALESIFKDVDKDKSGGLSRDELSTVGAGNYSADAKAAAGLMLDHFDAAQLFVSQDTKNDFGLSPAKNAFRKTFVSDDNENGISIKDLQSMKLVSSSEDVAKMLKDMRRNEQLWGTFNGVIAAGELGLSGFAMATGHVWAGVPIALFGASRALESASYFAASEVPKFSDYMNKRRDMIASWTNA